MRLQELRERYLERQALRGLSPHTLRLQGQVLGRAVQFFGNADNESLHRADWLRYLKTWTGAATSRYERCRMLRSWLGWALAEELVWKNPLASLALPCVTAAPGRVPTAAQVLALLEPIADARDRLLVELLYGAGLRRSELVALNCTDWDENEGTLRVRGKGNKVRLQPLGPSLQSCLTDYLHNVRPQLDALSEERALLLNDRGQRFPGHQVCPCIQKYARPGGLEWLTAHSLRRAFATHLLEGGASLAQVQALLGHANPHVTERYTEISMLELCREYQRTHPRGRLGHLPRRPPRMG